MNIILADRGEVTEEFLTLTDDRAKHIIKVLRAEVGDTVRVGVIDGNKGYGTITGLNKKHPRMVKLQLRLKQEASTQPRIDLIVAMARPIMVRRILSQATTLGVGSFYMIHANRVEKSFWDASVVEEKKYTTHLLHGLEQAVDTRLPQVSFHNRFKPFIEDFLPTILHNYSHHLVAHPGGSITLSESLKGETGRILLAIGPEGGWVDYEIKQFTKAGFTCCNMGKRILKVDTAVVALHSRITQLLEG